MKTADSEVLDAHFAVDKQNVSLWPPGKRQPLLRACLGLCGQACSWLLLHQTLSSASCRLSSQDMSVPGSGETPHGPRCGRLPDAGHDHLCPAAGHSL